MKDFPNICLGCKKDDVPLNDFVYNIRKVKKRTSGNTTTRTTTNLRTTFPACDTCEAKFEKAMNAGNLAKRLKRIMRTLIIALIFLLVMINLSFFPISFDKTTLYFIIIPIFSIVIILMVLQIIRASKNPYNIKNFLTFHKGGTYSINDPEYAKEMNDFIQETIEEEVKEELFGIDEENALYCPICSKQHKKGTDFCNVCGKDLRAVI